MQSSTQRIFNGAHAHAHLLNDGKPGIDLENCSVTADGARSAHLPPQQHSRILELSIDGVGEWLADTTEDAKARFTQNGNDGSIQDNLWAELRRLAVRYVFKRPSLRYTPCHPGELAAEPRSHTPGLS